MNQTPKPENEFESLAAQERDRSLLAELWEFLRENKKWWLLPMLVALGLVGMLAILAGTGAAPFIYTLF